MAWKNMESQVLAAMLESSLDGVLFTVPQQRVLAANPAACRLLGMTEEQICGRRNESLRDPGDPRWEAAVAELVGTGQVRADLRMRRGDGTTFEVEVSAAVFTDDQGEQRACVTFRDISSRLQLQRQLERAATVDVLTELANRRGFLQLAEHELSVAQREGGELDLLFLDVDRFKEINDTYGHAAGDEVLRLVAHVLHEVCRASDVIARLGGDEFVVLMRGSSAAHARATGRRIRSALAEHGDGLAVPVTLSIGAVHRRPGQTLEELLSEADARMYAQKNHEPRVAANGAAAARPAVPTPRPG